MSAASRETETGAEFEVIDTTSAGYDEAWPVLAAADARDEGKDLAGCARAVLKSIERSRYLFAPETLTFLQRGGRIGNAAALLGTLVQIIPILTIVDGKATTFAKVRTYRKALARMLDAFKEDMDALGVRNVSVHYIGPRERAVEWAREKVEPLVGHEVPVIPVSPVLGTHVGPAVGIAYECGKPVKGKLVESTPAVVSSEKLQEPTLFEKIFRR